jgi:hypothetical protein
MINTKNIIVNCYCKRDIVLPIGLKQNQIYCEKCKSNISPLYLSQLFTNIKPSLMGITIAEKRKAQDAYDYAQKVLEYYKKKITNVAVEFSWYQKLNNWVDKLSFYVAIVHSYAYVSYINIYFRRMGYKAILSLLTKQSGTYFILNLDIALFYLISRHFLDTDASTIEHLWKDDFGYKKELPVGSEDWEAYLETIADTIEEANWETKTPKGNLGMNLRKAVNLFKDTQKYLANKISIRGHTQKIPIKYAFENNPTMDDIIFEDSYSDKDLVLILEKTRGIFHSTGAVFTDIIYIPTTNKAEIYELFEILSKNAFNINLRLIYEYPHNRLFTPLFNQLKEI